MAGGWRTLDFSQASGSLHYRRGTLLFVSEEKETTIPIVQVAVVLIGSRVSISGGLLGKLSQLDIALIAVDWKNIPITAAQPWHEHSRIAARQIAQARLTAPRRKNAWARIIKSKVLGQAHTLALIGASGEAIRLRELSKTVRSGDLSNVEGLAAKIYWSALNVEKQFRRIPGSSASGFNSVLNYAYTLLRGQGVRSLALAGLAGTLGFHHKNRSNPFALVDDLIEPFRPAVDYHLATQLDHFDLQDKSCKQQVFACANTVFDESGHSISSVQEDFARNVGMYVEGDRKYLPVPTWHLENSEHDKEFQG